MTVSVAPAQFEFVDFDANVIAGVVQQLAQALGISEPTLDRLAARGLLRPSRATRRPLYAVAELERFLRETSKPEGEL